jgi:hypothetical protein
MDDGTDVLVQLASPTLGVQVDTPQLNFEVGSSPEFNLEVGSPELAFELSSPQILLPITGTGDTPNPPAKTPSNVPDRFKVKETRVPVPAKDKDSRVTGVNYSLR